MSESKALERLGIIKPKSPFRRFLVGLRRLLLLAVICCCVWGGMKLFKGVKAEKTAPSASETTQVPSADDGTFRLLTHIAVTRVAQYDQKRGRARYNATAVSTERTYWYKVAVDPQWYFSKFVPQIKKLLGEIANGVEVLDVKFSTAELAYSNDGADKLAEHGSASSSTVMGDGLRRWLQPGILSVRTSHEVDALRKTFRDLSPVLLIDGETEKGAVTQGKIYLLSEAQYNKLNSWMKQNVECSRGPILASAMSDGKEVGSGRFNFRGFTPVDSVFWALGRMTVISHWVNVRSGSRCCFLGVYCRDPAGFSNKVDIEMEM